MAPLPTTGDDAKRYLGAWGEISHAMESGTSWSGNERNVAWVNTRDGGFADVSAVAELDQIEDGRVVLPCDWDRDGDMDLWLRSRNGPTLRYLENQADPEGFVEVEFAPGVRHAHVDLRVEGPLGERTTRLDLRLADGYLAARSGRVTLALTDETIVQGTASVAGAPAGGFGVGGPGLAVRRFFVSPDGSATLRGAQPDRDPLAIGALESSDLPTRVVLRTALPVPPARIPEAAAAAARLVVVRDPECEVCERDVPKVAGALAAGDDVALTTLETGNPDDAAFVSFVSAIATDVLGPGAELDTPLSLLLDPAGNAQVLYIGGLDADTVTQDARWFALEPVLGAFRTTVGAPGGARWFHGMPRSVDGLVEELRRAGNAEDAAFYALRRR